MSEKFVWIPYGEQEFVLARDTGDRIVYAGWSVRYSNLYETWRIYAGALKDETPRGLSDAMREAERLAKEAMK